MVAAAALHELTDEHAFVDQIYRSPGGDETPTRELRVTRVDDHRLESARAEVVDPEHELIVRRHFAPIENRNPRCGALSAAPLLIGREQRVQYTVPRGQWPHIVAPQKRSHRGQRKKRLRQRIAVRRAGGSLGVVLGEVKYSLIGEKEGIDA